MAQEKQELIDERDKVQALLTKLQTNSEHNEQFLIKAIDAQAVQDVSGEVASPRGAQSIECREVGIQGG
jgi:hypothetical protein